MEVVVEKEVLHSGVEFEFHSFEDVFVFSELGSQQHDDLVITVQLGCVASCVFVEFVLVAEGDLFYGELLWLEVGL